MIRYNPASVQIDYGQGSIELKLNPGLANWAIIEPIEDSPLADFDDAFKEAIFRPAGTLPLPETVLPDDKIVIVTSDNTRPVPNKIIIPAIIRHCSLNPSNVTILVGSGSHRPHSADELIDLLGVELMRECRVICHDAASEKDLRKLGNSIPSNIPISINRHYLEADKKIVIGFIEPHFFAGYSGGAKGICPAICGIETILNFHSYDIIADPFSDYGYLDNNPQQLLAREVVSLAPPDFLINVTLNSRKEITGIYAGDYIEAHRAGSQAAKKSSMVEVSGEFPVVITSNSGFPLDQNLYQTVKGICTASRMVEKGGSIIAVSECRNGLPSGGNFERILNSVSDIRALRRESLGQFSQMADRWQVQKLVTTLEKASIYLYSKLDERDAELCGMTKIVDLESSLSIVCAAIGGKPNVGILPRGPLSVPH
ncbi:conserved hypothetical protein [Candidatus Zixiibacteriota bacterium]|nr:conserved hypothetical protein [candidate division Zixibacteria bacterium]